MPADPTRPTGRTYLTAHGVRRRYGITDMSIWRWLRDPALGFPQPLRIRSRRYWDLELLEAWDAGRAGAGVSTSTKSSLPGEVAGVDHHQVTAANAGLAELVELARTTEGQTVLLQLLTNALAVSLLASPHEQKSVRQTPSARADDEVSAQPQAIPKIAETSSRSHLRPKPRRART